jgi:hypothetical protein
MNALAIRTDPEKPVNRDEVDRLRKRFMKLDKVGDTAYNVSGCPCILIIYRMPLVPLTAMSSSPSLKCRPTRSPQGPLLSPHTYLFTPTLYPVLGPPYYTNTFLTPP